MDLSLDTGFSQRHISFIETGRSLPSRDTLIGLSDVLDIPLRERNSLFTSAGYAPIYSECPWDAPEMGAINAALQRMLRQHNPYPAVVLDRYWNVLLTNDSAASFFAAFLDPQKPAPKPNLLHTMFDPNGMRPYVRDWETVARNLIQRVYRESVGHFLDEATHDLMRELRAYPNVRPEWTAPEHASNLPLVPIGLNKDGAALNYFSLITTVGTPQTVMAQELRIECLFPADDATDRAHLAMLNYSQATSSM